MDIRLRASDPRVRLIDSDEFTTFIVSIAGVSELQWRSNPRHREDVSRLVGDVEIGAEESHVWVPIDLIETLANENGADQKWFESLASMVNYADSRGWLRDRCIRGHVVFADSAAE